MTCPILNCPECGDPLIKATSRGRYDRDGNYVDHGVTCRCRWCSWMWWDDAAPVTCECGAVVSVTCDDGHAYSTTRQSAR
jgi:ssDNA-binding Zn-finger/Zn-ribbon topoisomerase 1